MDRRGVAEGDGVTVGVGAAGEGEAVWVGVTVGRRVFVAVSVGHCVGVLLGSNVGRAVVVGGAGLVTIASAVG